MSKCPKCGEECIKYGTVKRVVRTKYRESEWIRVQRWKCRACGYIWRELPEDVVRYKQYEREMITGVQEGLIDSNVLGFEEYPCEATMKRWRRKNR